MNNDCGAVAIEAALIFPILVLIMFGVIEFSLMLRDHVSLTAAARSGVRTASAEPRIATFDADAAAALARAGVAMPMSSIDEMWVYESNVAGYPTNGGSQVASTPTTFTTCTTRCVKFTYDPVSKSFTKTAGSWASTLINACPGDVGMTSVGIYVKARHSFVTGLFGTTVSMADHAVMRFEPIPASQLTSTGGTCK